MTQNSSHTIIKQYFSVQVHYSPTCFGTYITIHRNMWANSNTW